MSSPERSAQEMLALAQKRHLTYKRPVTVKLDERIVLHLEDKGVGASRAIDLLLRQLLTDAGVDLTKPHPRETYSKEQEKDKEGNVVEKVITYQDHWVNEGLAPSTTQAVHI